VAVAMKRVAHKKLQANTVDIQNNGKRDMKIAPQVNVVSVCNVMDDEVASHKHIIVIVVFVGVISIMICLLSRMNLVGFSMRMFTVAMVLSQNNGSCQEKQGGGERPE
jgi:uncharacterized membrane protein